MAGEVALTRGDLPINLRLVTQQPLALSLLPLANMLKALLLALTLATPALVGDSLPLICPQLALVSQTLTLIGQRLTLVGDPLALPGDLLAPLSGLLALVQAPDPLLDPFGDLPSATVSAKRRCTSAAAAAYPSSIRDGAALITSRSTCSPTLRVGQRDAPAVAVAIERQRLHTEMHSEALHIFDVARDPEPVRGCRRGRPASAPRREDEQFVTW